MAPSARSSCLLNIVVMTTMFIIIYNYNDAVIELETVCMRNPDTVSKCQSDGSVGVTDEATLIKLKRL